MKTINVIGVLSANNSFGYLTQYFVKGLISAGYQVNFKPYWSDGSEVPELQKLQKPFTSQAKTVLIHWGQRCMESSMQDNAIVYTMTETSKITSEFCKILNRAKLVLVPTQFNKKVFINSGLTAPIVVSPLGVDLDIFKPAEQSFPKGAIFVTAGSNISGESRKGLNRVITAFMLAFPNSQDAYLWVKTRPDDVLMQSYNPRVQHIAQNLTQADMVKFYQQALCYVSGSWGEGWGWHINEAMACGKPVISVKWGGAASYFHGNKHGCEVDYNLTPYNDLQGLCGVGAMPTIESLADQMQKVYHNRLHYFVKGLQASMDVASLTIKNMQQTFLTHIKNYV